MEYLPRLDVWCIEQRLPLSVHGFVCRKGGLTFMVINSDLSEEKKRETIQHEMDHLNGDDLLREESATEIEEELCTRSKNLTENGWCNFDSTAKQKR